MKDLHGCIIATTVVSAMLKVGVIKRRTLNCLKVHGDSKYKNQDGLGEGHRCRNLEIVKEVDTYVAETK